MRDITRRLCHGLLAAGAAQWVLLPALWTTGQRVPPSFFFANFVALLGFQWLAALGFGKPGQERAWASFVFVVPIGLALYPLADGAALGGPLQLVAEGVVLAAAAILCTRWGRLGPRPGAPVVSATLGTAVGTALLYWTYEEYHGAETAIQPAAILAGFGFVCLLLALFGGKLALHRLPAGGALALGLLMTLAAAFAAPLDFGPRASPPKAIAPNAARPPIVLIVLDTLRADRLASYGSERDTMPLLEAFAREHAVTFERARANSPWTLPTHASLFTGLVPPRHGAHSSFQDDANPPASYYPLAFGKATLANHLSRAGYWTLGIVANSGVLSPFWGLSRGFDYYTSVEPASFVMKRYTPWRVASDWHWPLEALDAIPPFSRASFFGKGLWVRDAEDISDEAIALIDYTEDLPFFLFLNYIDAHDPYTPYAEFLEDELLEPPTERLRGDWRKVWRAVISGDEALSKDESNYLLAVYDSELGYLDFHLARLLERLSQHPRWDEMMVIVTSDHGESLGEHALVGHGHNLYDEVIRVPLFVKPGRRAGGDTPHAIGSIARGPIESVDIFPTVLEHAGVRVPSGIDGLAWGSGRTETKAWLYWPPLAVEQNELRFDRELRSIQRGDWKLIESSRHETELYDLHNDPRELVDRSEMDAAKSDALRVALGPGQREPERRALAKPPTRKAKPPIRKAKRGKRSR